MPRPSPILLAALLAAPLFGAPPAPTASAPIGPDRAFLQKHCTECHDSEVSKGDLNLADLKFDPSSPANFRIWQRSLERVRDGEMPPSKKPRPDPVAAEGFIRSVEQPLLAADRKDVLENGRVRGRRLTRVEYEHTLHDLLGIDIPLKESLPEDPLTQGFQTVAEGQQLSHHQLGRYLEAADLALKDAFARADGLERPFSRKVAPADLEYKGNGNNRGPEFRDGLSISWPMSLQFYGRMHTTVVPADGWYRVTLRQVRAINPGKDGAVWGTLRSGHCESNAPILYMMGLVEATAQPRDLVYTGWIQKGHRLELRPNDYTLKRPPSGATGGSVSYVGRDLAKEGFSGIAHAGLEIERIHPFGSDADVARALYGDLKPSELRKTPVINLQKLVTDFARRAFRRPVSPEQVAPYFELGKQALQKGDDFKLALQAAYRAVLCSPRFLTFVEKTGELDDYAVASRLSYAFWCSLPDAELLRLAESRRLRQPEVLRQQAQRLIDDPKSERFMISFTDQWLKLSTIDFTSPDPRQFPTFDPVLQESMLQETRAYVRELLRRDLSVTHLLDSDFVFLNGRLARHYGIAADLRPGAGLQKVDLPTGQRANRGGLLTQGAILKVTADGSATSPVIRGVFVNEKLLGVHIPPPPASVPALEPDVRGATSIREQLEKHRSSESCASCHRTIDPAGFALETFDPVGNLRTRYAKGLRINSAGQTPDGKAFTGLADWRQLYLTRREQLARGFAGHFLTYATGAAPRLSDEDAVSAVARAAGEQGHGLRSLVLGAVASPVFLRK